MTKTQNIQSDFVLNKFFVKELYVKTEEIVDGTQGIIQFDVTYELEYSESETQRIGSVKLFVKAVAMHETETMFEVELKCLGNYNAQLNKLEKAKFMELLEYNGIALILPLVRAYLFTATSQWGIGPPLMFPTINVVKLVEKHKKEMSEK